MMIVPRGISRITRRCYSTKPQLIDFSSAESWRNSLKQNKLLNRLYQLERDGKVLIKPHNHPLTKNDYNASEMLPITVLPNQEISTAVIDDISIANWRKPLVKWFRIGKFLLGMYKDGVKYTWSSYFSTKNFSFDSKQLTKLIEFKEIESRILKQNKLDELRITRREYLLWLRRNEFWKLPQFVFVFVLLEELTFVLSYLFPSMSPWNCLTPGLYKKISDSRTKKLVDDFTTESRYLSPYDLERATLLSFLKGWRVISPWRLKIFQLTKEYKIPINTIVELYQKIVIDDWLLLQGLLKEETTGTVLSDKELVDAILRRQLYLKGEDLNKMVLSEDGQKVLTLRLLIYLSFKFDETISSHDFEGKLFSERWGVNNMAIFNFCGSSALIEPKDLEMIET